MVIQSEPQLKFPLEPPITAVFATLTAKLTRVIAAQHVWRGKSGEMPVIVELGSCHN